MKQSEAISNDNLNTIDSSNIQLEALTETGGNTTSTIVFTDAVFQYITAASTLRNTTISELLSGYTDTAVKQFYSVVKNGLGPLRDGSEQEAQIFYNYYINKTNKYNTIFLVIMIVGIVILVISELILIPIVFSVHKTNNRVLSLFGYIPEDEIDELVEKCKDYMENYLEEHREQRDYSFEGSEEEAEPSNRQDNLESSYLEVSQHQDIPDNNNNDSENPDSSMNMDVSEKIKPAIIGAKTDRLADSLKVPNQNNSASARLGYTTTPQSPASSMVVSPEKEPLNPTLNTAPAKKSMSRGDKDAAREEDKKKEDADFEAERAFNKSQKLLNSKDNRRSKVMIQFIGIALLFFMYFLLDYLWIEKSFLSNVKLNLLHLQLSASRTSQIRYMNAFALEEIATANPTYVYTFGSNGPYSVTLLTVRRCSCTKPQS